MNRFHPATSALFTAAFLGMFCSIADAQDIYKWIDAEGKTHYGDRAAAPGNSKKIPVTVAPSSQPPVVPVSTAASQPRSPLLPQRDPQVKSVPVEPSRVGPACQGLIKQIAAVRAGQHWEALYQQFNNACPGIAYECVEYESNPQNNRCVWIERTGSKVLNRKRYP